MSDGQWQPIEDLPANWRDLTSSELVTLGNIWREQADRLRQSQAYNLFLNKMRRRIAIETGVLERLYTLDRGITQLLIEGGIDEALIPYGATDRPVGEVVALIRDHENALEGLFKFASRQRQLSLSYIKELHQALTQNQTFTEARDQFGRLVRLDLIRGDWKRLPNNPTRPNGSVCYYCPPEQVQPQMERLIAWHVEHNEIGVLPEIEAAWLHHRFTQIHPFQDGNGRVARMLASLIFIRAGWFPLVITRDERAAYIEALERADSGDLKPLVDLFAMTQRQAFVSALSLSEQAISQHETVQSLIASVAAKVQNQRARQAEETRLKVEAIANRLFGMAQQRLQEIADEIFQGLRHELPTVQAFVSFAQPSDQERAGYYRYQIIETARQLGYYANLSAYKSWLSLIISLADFRIEILLSFHYVGDEPSRGLMACSACAYRKSYEEGSTGLIQDLEPLSDPPFYFSHVDAPERTAEQFVAWLENVIVTGLEYWRRAM